MIPNARFWFVSTLALLSTSAAFGAGMVVPDASYFVLLAGSPSQVYHAPGTYDGGLSEVVLQTTPYVSIFATAPTGTQFSATAWAAYYVEFDYTGSGTPDASIPILIHTSLDARADPQGGIASATLYIDDNQYARAFCNYGFTCDTPHVDQTISFLVTPGVADRIEIDVGASGSPTGFATAFADPFISIDPTFANAGNYTLTISNGIGNADPSIPEPATYLMVPAAGVILALSRRRRAA